MSKTVLITGASSGIGLELSKLFAKNGYNLVMVSQNKDNLQKAKDLITNDYHGIKVYSIAKNLAEPSTPDEIYQFTQQQKIEVDFLVNNAGIQVYGNFHEVDVAKNLELMNINMYSLTKLTGLYLEGMVKRGFGKVLNIASTGAFQAVPLNTVYCASKSYVLNFSEGIREELKGTGVTVTALCPGATRSNFAKRAHIEAIKLFNSNQVLSPEYVANIGYKALMKDKSVAVTGFYYKLLIFSVRLMPRKVTTKIAMNMMRA